MIARRTLTTLLTLTVMSSISHAQLFEKKTLYLTAQTSIYRIRLNIPGVRPRLAANK
jgi:hypothetical protein